MRSRLLRGALQTAAWLTLFIVCVYALFPVKRINAYMDRTLSAHGLILTPPAGKSIIPGLAWNSLQLSSEQGALLRLERMTIRPSLPGLLTGRLVLDSKAVLPHGGMDVRYTATGTRKLQFTAEKLDLGDFPFFKTVLGAKVGGVVRSDVIAEQGAKGWNGELKLELNRLEFSGIKVGAFALPDAANLRSRGMVRITDGKARLESLTLEGDGLYMRVSGEIPAGLDMVSAPLNLVLEIMPKPDFLDKQKLVFMMMAKFLVSPGVYRLPVTGTLLKPQVI